MNLLELLEGQMSDEVVGQLSTEIRADKDATQAATSGVFATLVSALARNAAKPDSGNSLLNALDRDHDGSVLNDVMGLFGGSTPQPRQKATNGLGILEHVLGGNINNVVQMVSKSSGLDFLKTGQLMKLLAPMVMGTLGQTKRKEGLDLGGLSQILSGTVQNVTEKRQDMGIISKVLDADGDGNVMDDIAGIGMKVLGGLFRK
ncbi:MAG: DUF937 domain-containing protein [Saprospiraceae bacterium]|nr:DUF937 domain-containing protein [Saprospiraceae bacterium]